MKKQFVLCLIHVLERIIIRPTLQWKTGNCFSSRTKCFSCIYLSMILSITMKILIHFKCNMTEPYSNIYYSIYFFLFPISTPYNILVSKSHNKKKLPRKRPYDLTPEDDNNLLQSLTTILKLCIRDVNWKLGLLQY